MSPATVIADSKIARVALTHLTGWHHPPTSCGDASDRFLKIGQVKEIHEMKGTGCSICQIARHTVCLDLKSPEALKIRPQPRMTAKLIPYL